MLRRLSATALTALLLGVAAHPAGAAPAHVADASAPAPATARALTLGPSLRVVPDTRVELGMLPPAIHPAPADAAPAAAEPAPEPAEVVEAAPVAPAAPAAVWPVDRGTPITDGFGPRVAPTAGASTDHRGLDFGAAAGTPVVAAAAGVVTHVVATDTGGCGIEVVIQHDEGVGGVSTRYCHLLEGSPLVGIGTPVEAGQQIAAVGSTGVSTGAHLHFEVQLPGGVAIDPLGWLEQYAG